MEAQLHTVRRLLTRRCGPAVSHPSIGRPRELYGSRPVYSGQRYSSFGMRSSPSSAYRRPYIYSSRGSFTRSGPYTVATIPQGNRIAPFANHRNQMATNVWNQWNTGRQFRNGNNLRNGTNFRNANNQLRNGNNHLRADWHNHVFAQRSGDWHRDWDRHSDHWWNGHRCCFINGSWVIFSAGFYPWWPSYYPDDYYYDYGFPNDGYGSSTYGYDPNSYNYDPGYYNSGDYQGQMDYDQNSYPDQSQGYYDSSVYQTGAYYDPNGYSGQSQSNYSTVAAAQERLAREGTIVARQTVRRALRCRKPSGAINSQTACGRLATSTATPWP